MGEILFRWLLTANGNISVQAESHIDFRNTPIATDSRAVIRETELCHGPKSLFIRKNFNDKCIMLYKSRYIATYFEATSKLWDIR